MNSTQVEIDNRLDTVVKTAELMRRLIRQPMPISPDDWITIGMYVGHLGKAITEIAPLAHHLVRTQDVGENHQ